ncbi:MAG: hypothetical protein GY722_01515, partial [bacterium]|nr:hypothetical protein [bacterium]
MIGDDDDCSSPNLLLNGSAEAPLAGGELPGWTEVVGSAWSTLPRVCSTVERSMSWRNSDNATVLDVFDSGEIVNVSGWHRLSDLKLAPAGTRFIRVRLITARWGGDNADGYFDGLAVRSLGTPVFQFSDQQIFEGDVGNDLVPYRVTLTCPSAHVVSLDYQLVDGTAVAPLDYVDQASTLTFAAGEVEQTIELEIVGE